MQPSTVTDPFRDPMVGLVVNNYVVRKRLAEGGMGAVYLAEHRDPRSKSKKVIKVLLGGYSWNAVTRQRFEEEALAGMRLKHRYIASVDDFGTLPDGQLYLMMEFLEGKTLEEHIQQNQRLSQHHTLHIIAQILRALHYLHESGIVHRDLKPGNIFILHTDENPYEVRLIDLGIARNLEQPLEQPKKTVTGMAMGTPGYMAVEQYGDAGNATPAADVYAAAVIVWRMLTGQLPWGELYDERILYYRQMSEDFEVPPGVDLPAELVALLRRGLSKDPKTRPSVPDFAAIFASLTPAIPPHVPSGAEILGRVAKKFIEKSSAGDETVRNVSTGEGSTPMLWPPRATRPSEPAVTAQPAATPVIAPTANDRPGAMIAAAPRPTTLSASSGVIAAATPTAGPGRRAFLAIGTCVLAAAATFAIVRVGRGAGAKQGDADHRDFATMPAVNAPSTLTISTDKSHTGPATTSHTRTELTNEGSAPAPGSGTNAARATAAAPTEPPPTASSAPSESPAADTASTGSAGNEIQIPRTKEVRASGMKPRSKKAPSDPAPREPPRSQGRTESGSASAPRKDVPFDPNAVEE
ncbi:MAG: protein kinase domain-containing protein [Kofleriaceae bacterium]